MSQRMAQEREYWINLYSNSVYKLYEQVFYKGLNKFLVVFIDDILVYFITWEKHI